MIQPQDCVHMDRALMLAERGRGRTSPNPMVGAVIVSPDGRVIGSGYHARAGEPHAEINALSSVIGEGVRGATLYCTLEPCCHTGRTGPCVDPIEEAGIARVVAAVEDPNPLVAGAGVRHLRAHGVEVDVGVRRKAATLLNRAFFTFVRQSRPFVILKAATSSDGCIAARPGERTAISSVESRRHAQQVRAEVDAIAIGSETLLVDDPLLTAREAYRYRPLVRVVFDRRLRTPPTARLFSTIAEGPVIIMTGRQAIEAHPDRVRALEGAGARLEACDDLRSAARRLGELRVTSLLIEGGARLHEAAWDAGIVDFVQVYVASGVIGHAGVRFMPDRALSLAALVDGGVTVCGTDVLVEGYVHRID
jgi:diaminohydroxyphosphoribosylaminopyrimidine deaminase / 5-amino-6-(5-phosphoribosylamino)uracil reductase